MQMNELEYLIMVLGEEGVEVSQTTTKIARFGMGDRYKDTDPSNMQNFITEVNDFYAVCEMIEDYINKFGGPLALLNLRNQGMIDAKKERLRKFIEYSKFRVVISN